MDKRQLFSQLPSVDELLKKDIIKTLIDECSKTLVVKNIRQCLESMRKKIIGMDVTVQNSFRVDISELLDEIIKGTKKEYCLSLKKVINGTGVVLHTNLGRSLLSESITKQAMEIACRYSNLEYDLDSGSRGSRYKHIESIIKELTGAEAVLVVNNNAAAVLLVLNTLAQSKEVIVSRGELVEIGGAFRIPSVMKQSGSKLVEVGTTNKTHLSDYEEAINENTAGLLKVHTSNYKILGFTKNIEIDELTVLSKKYNVPIIEDLGSGLLIDLSKYGLSYEPTVMDSLKKGVDILTFSGDKMLGGPQAGIILGKQEYIDRMKKNQLTRALRVDKVTLAFLEATFRLYLDESKAIKEIPILNMLTSSIEVIECRAIKLFNMIKEANLPLDIILEDGYSQVGGGSMPLENINSKLISMLPSGISLLEFEKGLRLCSNHIIGRISNDRYYLDVRTIFEDELDIIVKEIKKVLK